MAWTMADKIADNQSFFLFLFQNFILTD